ncbi:helix-turn-helix domain-containing protein [Salegentibacter maritimus]|uniref:helix-turn-helix domain-containing protein n=1 Tax=Salegentibacter maritimus TaxID=2794347 RepID=UPI0018E45EF4|nr:helix-turn-helix domain-containing protein [Salegentibacter maritimus]MBI6116013.1 helix-turn-helix domain-containing protein [Salegentibacter maritimus]
MAKEIITTDDLMIFKLELFDELKRLMEEHSYRKNKRYLKSAEVKELLGISAGTLHNIRINGNLPYTKIGGTIFYDWNDIQRIMKKYRIDNSF